MYLPIIFNSNLFSDIEHKFLILVDFIYLTFKKNLYSGNLVRKFSVVAEHHVLLIYEIKKIGHRLCF